MEEPNVLVETLDKIKTLSTCTLSQHKLGIENVQTFINQAKYAAEHIVLLVDSLKLQMSQQDEENESKIESIRKYIVDEIESNNTNIKNAIGGDDIEYINYNRALVDVQNFVESLESLESLDE